MTSTPSVSVVIPCYNAAPYIGTAIDSVVEQQWPDLEIIVVDDGSSDGSAQVAAAHGAGVHVIRQSNAGPGAARNVGIEAARGEYIAFLDADDLWLPGKLARQIALMQRTPDARMSYGSWHVWHSNGDVRPSAEWLREKDMELQTHDGEAKPSGWVYCDLLLDTILNSSTVLAHRSLFGEVGRFDTSLPVGEDYDLWLRMSRVTQIVRVPSAVALYRLHKMGTTKVPRETNYQALVLERALERWGYIGPDGVSANKAAVTRGLARVWRDFALGHIRAGNWSHARAASLRAWRLERLSLANLRVLARSVLNV